MDTLSTDPRIHQIVETIPVLTAQQLIHGHRQGQPHPAILNMLLQLTSRQRRPDNDCRFHKDSFNRKARTTMQVKRAMFMHSDYAATLGSSIWVPSAAPGTRVPAKRPIASRPFIRS